MQRFNTAKRRTVKLKDGLHPTKGYRRQTTALDRWRQSQSVTPPMREKQSKKDKATDWAAFKLAKKGIELP